MEWKHCENSMHTLIYMCTWLAFRSDNHHYNAEINVPVVTSFSVAVAVVKKTKILCGQLSDRCTTCQRFD